MDLDQNRPMQDINRVPQQANDQVANCRPAVPAMYWQCVYPPVYPYPQPGQWNLQQYQAMSERFPNFNQAVQMGASNLHKQSGSAGTTSNQKGVSNATEGEQDPVKLANPDAQYDLKKRIHNQNNYYSISLSQGIASESEQSKPINLASKQQGPPNSMDLILNPIQPPIFSDKQNFQGSSSTFSQVPWQQNHQAPLFTEPPVTGKKPPYPSSFQPQPSLDSWSTQTATHVSEKFKSHIGPEQFENSRKMVIAQCELFTEQLYELHKLYRVQQSQVAVLLHPEYASSQQSITKGGSMLINQPQFQNRDEKQRRRNVRQYVLYMNNLPKVVRSAVNTDGLEKTCVKKRYVPQLPKAAIKPTVHNQHLNQQQTAPTNKMHGPGMDQGIANSVMQLATLFGQQGPWGQSNTPSSQPPSGPQCGLPPASFNFHQHWFQKNYGQVEKQASQIMNFVKEISAQAGEKSWTGSGQELLNIAAVAAAASLSTDPRWSEQSLTTSSQRQNFNTVLNGIRELTKTTFDAARRPSSDRPQSPPPGLDLNGVRPPPIARTGSTADAAKSADGASGDHDTKSGGQSHEEWGTDREDSSKTRKRKSGGAGGVQPPKRTRQVSPFAKSQDSASQVPPLHSPTLRPQSSQQPSAPQTNNDNSSSAGNLPHPKLNPHLSPQLPPNPPSLPMPPFEVPTLPLPSLTQPLMLPQVIAPPAQNFTAFGLPLPSLPPQQPQCPPMYMSMAGPHYGAPHGGLPSPVGPGMPGPSVPGPLPPPPMPPGMQEMGMALGGRVVGSPNRSDIRSDKEIVKSEELIKSEKEAADMLVKMAGWPQGRRASKGEKRDKV